MFRTAENVPEIYVNESRDFQVFARVKDASFNAVKYAIDSIRHTSNTLEMNSTLLALLKSKVGFFESDQLTEDQLRYLLAGFPALLRNKGSKNSIQSAANLWLRIYQLDGRLNRVEIINKSAYADSAYADLKAPYSITLYLDTSPRDTSLLDTIFKYILPTGYLVNYVFADVYSGSENSQFIDNITGILASTKHTSNVAHISDQYPEFINNVGMAEVVTYANNLHDSDTISCIEMNGDNKLTERIESDD